MDRPVFTGTFRGGICVMMMRCTACAAAKIRCTDTHRRKNTLHRHAPPQKYGCTDTHRRKNTPLKQADGLCLPNPSSMC